MKSQRYSIALPTKKRERLRFGRNAVVVLLVFALYCFVNVWQNVSITHLIRRNEALRRELTQVSRRCDVLAYELERLKSPDHIKSALSGVSALAPAETMVIKRGGRRR